MILLENQQQAMARLEEVLQQVNVTADSIREKAMLSIQDSMSSARTESDKSGKVLGQAFEGISSKTEEAVSQMKSALLVRAGCEQLN